MIKVHSDGVNAVRHEISKVGLILPYTVGVFRAMDSDRIIKVGRRGVSDTIACIDGRFYGIEIKTNDRDKQTTDQEKFQAAVQRAGGVYILADFRKGRDGLEDVRRAL